MKNKLMRKDFLLLTILLTHTTLAWGMDDPEETFPVNHSTSDVPQIAHRESDKTTYSPMNSLDVQKSMPQKRKVIIPQKIDPKILAHLKTFGLSIQKIEIVWREFNEIRTQTRPFCLGTQKPYFIASGLWRAHQEMTIQHQTNQTSLPLQSMLSCLLTKEFVHKKKKISLNEIQLIKSLVQSNPYFTRLELFNAGITDTHLSIMGTIPHVKGLSLENSSEERDALESNIIGDLGIQMLMAFLNLQELNLSKNKITSQQVEILAKSPTLKHLNLYKTPIGDEGAEFLSYNTVLDYLDLRETGIGDKGAEALSTNNQTLTSLNLRYNNITDKGAETFLKCHHLIHLELGRNQISKDHEVLLESLMPSNGYFKLPNHKLLAQPDLPPQKDKVRVLSIDGGGIRGLLPGVVLKYVEDGLTQATGSQFYFAPHLDLMAGTSTGGIISLGLIMPGERGRPKYTIQTLIDLYTKKGCEIFPSPWFGPGIFNATYSPGPIEKYLKEYFGETLLSESLCPTLITSVDIKNNKPHTFDSYKAKKEESKNFQIQGVGRATSAAPTYFPSAKIKNTLDEDFELVDGGLFANNPTLLAIKRAQQLYPDAKEYMVYSFGTGQASKQNLSYLGSRGLGSWALNIADVLMDKAAEYTKELINAEIKNDPRIKYMRIQPKIQISEKEMDNVDPENIESLLKTAQTTIEKKKMALDAMIEDFYTDFAVQYKK